MPDTEEVSRAEANVLILGGCLALTCLAAEPTPPPRPAAPNFEAWIDDLGDSDYHKRERPCTSSRPRALPPYRPCARPPIIPTPKSAAGLWT